MKGPQHSAATCGSHQAFPTETVARFAGFREFWTLTAILNLKELLSATSAGFPSDCSVADPCDMFLWPLDSTILPSVLPRSRTRILPTSLTPQPHDQPLCASTFFNFFNLFFIFYIAGAVAVAIAVHLSVTNTYCVDRSCFYNWSAVGGENCVDCTPHQRSPASSSDHLPAN